MINRYVFITAVYHMAIYHVFMLLLAVLITLVHNIIYGHFPLIRKKSFQRMIEFKY